MSRRHQNMIVMVILIILVTGYDILIYTQPDSSTAPMMSDTALEGEKVWQRNNCASCHQLYGLGGYLGPDLTNITSARGKDEVYINAFVESGTETMPSFQLSDREKHELFVFLDHVNKTGYYPLKNVEFNSVGWGALKYR